MTSRGNVIVDVQSLQSPTTRGRGIGRFTMDWCLALERLRPDLVGSYLLNAKLPPPGAIDDLVATGKLAYGPPHLKDARVFHTVSPLDLAVPMAEIWPVEAQDAGLLLSATVYDLIQAIDAKEELTDPIDRSKLRARLELIRAADSLQVLSASVARDLHTLLGIASARVAHVGCAPARLFIPPASREQARDEAIRAFAHIGLRDRFVLYPSGNHPRKNNEALIDAWAGFVASQPEPFQLVITGEFPASTTHHLFHLANSLGIRDRVVLPGYVGDHSLLRLYQGADLVCFPSLKEGFGLPVAEAIACRTPVIASDRPPLDELLTPIDRFDPTDTAHIAAALTSAIARREEPRHLGNQNTSTMTWDEVATRSAAVFDELISSSRKRTRTLSSRRPRLAFVTPLPPLASGVAHYSYRLIEEMLATNLVDIDVYSEGPSQVSLSPAHTSSFNVASLQAVERLSGPYDEVIYSIGNSHNHLGALRMLRERRGVVLSHDVRLSNLYRHAHGDPGLLPGGFARALQAMYDNQLPADLGVDGELSDLDIDRYGVFMAREIIQSSKTFFVTSQAAAELARIDAGARCAALVAVLPFAMEAPRREELGFLEDIAATNEPAEDVAPRWTASPSLLTGRPIIGHFGIVDPIKLPHLLLEGFAQFRANRPDAILAFVGPIADDLSHALIEQARDLNIVESLAITGAVSSAIYLEWMERTTIAVQLRQSSNGEASAAVGECLASGLPTITNDLGWFRELPTDAVVKLARSTRADELGRVLLSLDTDHDQRRALGAQARRYAEAHSFAAVARELIERLNVRRKNSEVKVA